MHSPLPERLLLLKGLGPRAQVCSGALGWPAAQPIPALSEPLLTQLQLGLLRPPLQWAWQGLARPWLQQGH